MKFCSSNPEVFDDLVKENIGSNWALVSLSTKEKYPVIETLSDGEIRLKKNIIVRLINTENVIVHAWSDRHLLQILVGPKLQNRVSSLMNDDDFKIELIDEEG